MEDKTKSGYVTIIGRPNVGKSTLMNALIGQKIAITSNKPQTTRNRIKTVYTDDRGQIVFLDTPGIHKSKNKMGDYMMKVSESTLHDVDVILWLVEVTNYIGTGERTIIESLYRAGKPVILVVTKTDCVKEEPGKSKKQKIFECIETYSKEFKFNAIIPISAKHKRGTDELMQSIFDHLPYGPLYYDEDTVTDQTEREIAAEIIREKALRNLGDEVPHGIAVTIEKMKERTNAEGDLVVDIESTLNCERESHKGIIIGAKGATLKKIGTEARLEIEKQFEYKVNLKLWVKVKKDWRESEQMMRSFGYDKDALSDEN